MKLLRHELFTILRRWNWIIPMWWLMVFIDLGYQCGWWWEAPVPDEIGLTVWQWTDHMHSNLSGLIQFLIWFGLALSALTLFVGISPYRLRSPERVRPVSDRIRILSRLVALSGVVGLPWYLHEMVYLFVEAEASFGFVLIAVVMRIAMTVALWFVVGAVGWVCGSLSKSYLCAGIGVAGLSGVFLLLAKIGTPSEGNIDPALPDAGSFAMMDIFGGAITVGILVWLARRVMQRPAGFAVVSALTGVTFWLVVTVSSNWSKSLAIASVSKDTPQITVDDSELRSSFSILSDNEVKASWQIGPQWKDLPEDLVPWSKASGEVSFHKGGELPFDWRFAGTIEGWNSYSLVRKEQRHWMELFPRCVVFCHHANPEVGIRLATNPSEPLRLPKDRSLDAVAELTTGAWRIQAPVSLPLDGSKGEFGSFGRAWVERIGRSVDGGLVLGIRFHQQQHLPVDPGSLKTRKLFALHHEENKELAITRHGQSEIQLRGESSSAPLAETTVTFFPLSLPEAARSGEWLAGARLILLEERFEGAVTQTVEQPDAGLWSKGTTTTMYEEIHLPRAGFSVEPELGPALTDPAASEFEVSEAFYRIARRPPLQIPSSIPVAEAHRDLLRDLVLRHPPAISWFSDFWTDQDGEFFLTKLPELAEGYWSRSYIALHAVDRGWFNQHPDSLKEYLRTEKRPHPEILEVAASLDIEHSVAAIYRSGLTDLQNKNAFQRERFPDIWDETLAELRKEWEEQKWRIRQARRLPISGFRLARLGEPAPLREMLTWYSRWEPAVDWSVFEKNPELTRDPWWIMRQFFPKAETSSKTPKAERLDSVRRWLAAEWEYDSATMTYRVLP